jgi:hypothetical protein
MIKQNDRRTESNVRQMTNRESAGRSYVTDSCEEVESAVANSWAGDPQLKKTVPRGGDELGRLAGAPGDVSHTDRVVVASHQGLHHLPSQRVIHCTGLQ